MDVLDVALLVIVIGAAIHGARVGAAVQLISFIGFLVGLVLGVVLAAAIAPSVNGQLAKALVALVVVLVPAALFGGIGRQLGMRAWSMLRRVRFGTVDLVAGGAIAIASTLFVCWLFASVLVNSTFSTLSRQIEQSRILRGVDTIMPPVPDAFATVQRYLSDDGFPQVLVNILPEAIGPVVAPSGPQVRAAAAIAGPSTVKVIAFGCGEEQEGSGFSVGDDLIVTNAHVIAGTANISVYTPNGNAAPAEPVLFDSRFDLAILKVPGLGLHALPVDTGLVERGTKAAALGYPEGGPFSAVAAGVASRFDAQGRNIYDNALTNRIVYELSAVIRPGNSGGPLVTPNGEVIGVVFSRSASNPEIGYALASPGVAERVNEAEHTTSRVSTEGCVG